MLSKVLGRSFAVADNTGSESGKRRHADNYFVVYIDTFGRYRLFDMCFAMLRKPLAVTLPLLVSMLQQVAGQTIEDQQLYYMRLTAVDIPGVLSERPQALLNEFYHGTNDGIYLKERVMKSDTTFGIVEIAPRPTSNPYQDVPIPDSANVANANANGVPSVTSNGVSVNIAEEGTFTTSQQTVGDDYVDAESAGTIFNDGTTVNSDIYGEYWGFHRLPYKRDPTGTRFAVQFTSRHRVTDEGYNGLPSVWIAGNPAIVKGMGGELLQLEDGTVTLDAPPGDLWDVFACGITPNLSDPGVNPFTVPAILWQILTVQRAVWSQIKYPGISDANPFCVAVRMTLEPVSQTPPITSDTIIEDITDTAAVVNGNGQILGTVKPMEMEVDYDTDVDYEVDPTNGFAYDASFYANGNRNGDTNTNDNAIYDEYPSDFANPNAFLQSISEASSSLEDSATDLQAGNSIRLDAVGNQRSEQADNSQGPLELPDSSDIDPDTARAASFDWAHPINPIQRFNSYTFEDQRGRAGMPEFLGGIQRFYSAGDLNTGGGSVYGAQEQAQVEDTIMDNGVGTGTPGAMEEEVARYP
ncbi:hypothetical protein Dda_6091 [Drechslerella dactyloides]|uniref:Uncharacterized protein n=1 Tax=Drechslerella dactyloides TaxID=74499 RepID=A0AAD6NJM0_DREDA|nr:hypothetical protein Dda_6091 [Drechslerella dactyloides]